MVKRSPVLAILCLLASLLLPSPSLASTSEAAAPRARCVAVALGDASRASSAFASRAAFEAAGASHTAATIAGVVASIAGPGKLNSAAKRSWGFVRQGGNRAAATAVGEAAAREGAKAAGKEPTRIYSARELVRRAEDAGPFHNFPEFCNESIFKGKRQVISDDYVQYTQRGSPNGREGAFEIGVRPSASGRSEVITHRSFNPDK